MEVLINNHPIEFQLGDEDKVSNIIASISKWASDRGLIFNEVFIDKKLYRVEEVDDFELADVDIINCVIESRANIIFSTIDEGTLYCSKVLDFIDRSSKEGTIDRHEVSNLSEGIDWMIDVLDKIINLIGIDREQLKYRDKSIIEFESELKELGARIVTIKEDNSLIKRLEESAVLFTGLKEIYRNLLLSEEMKSLILKSIDSPDELMTLLYEVKETLPAAAKKIEETAVSFQSGKDSEGVEKLNEFIEFMLRYTRICYQIAPVFGIDLSNLIIDDISLESVNNDVMAFLNEIIEAMENDDIISLADILEYEIMPAINDLGEYVDLLIREIGN